MSVLLRCISILVLICCCLAAPSLADKSTEDATRSAVLRAHTSLVQAYESSDAAGFSALLEPSGELLIFHPIYENLFLGPERTQDGIRRMFRLIGEAAWTDITTKVRVLGDVAWVMTTSQVESKRHAVVMDTRGTEVWVNTKQGWRLTHAHWSQNPERVLD
jgi:ketosteroid isomerase-like protein